MLRPSTLTLLVVATLATLTACYDRATTSASYVTVPAPGSLSSVSLNGAIYLTWDDTPYLDHQNDFLHYQVYSTSYDLDHNVCGTSWSVEGTTVAPEFLVGALTNGVPRCFVVTSFSVDNYESADSPERFDTPRPDARNVVLFSTDTLSGAQSGFRFWLDANNNGAVDANELGLVGPAGSGINDFIVTRDANGVLWIQPQIASDSMQVYGNTPIADLTSIDVAPASNYEPGPFSAVPMWGYVFQTRVGSFYQYGAIRVTAVGPRYVILDWSYQTDPGNPELVQPKR